MRRQLRHLGSVIMHNRRAVVAFAFLSFCCWKFFDSDNSVSINGLSIELATGALEIQRDPGNIVFSGHIALDPELKGIRAQVSPSCTGNQICLEYPSLAKLTITAVDIEPEDVRCFSFNWLPLKDHINPEDCFDNDGHWYGGAEVFKQHWPIDKQKSLMQPFQSGDFLSKHYLHSGMGKYGAILEPYWISSKGAGIHVNHRVPLHSSFNANQMKLPLSKNAGLCIKADPEYYYHSNMKNGILHRELKYTICTASNIKEVHQYMSKRFLQLPTKLPDARMFRSPIWSTWARYKTKINQTLVLQYAAEINKFGFSNSQLEIDDKYTSTYGDLDWDSEKFPDPKSMVDKLKDMGFRVTTWTHPFANIDTEAFQEGSKRGFFLKDMTGNVPGLVEWWQGTAGVLDVTNKGAVSWFTQIHREFMERYGIDSLKFDAGEVNHTPFCYSAAQQPLNLNDYTKEYAEMVASLGSMVELRAAYRSQHLPVFYRMLDKFSNWGYDNGLRTLIPTALLMSTIGYQYILPDMIGGNAHDENDSPLNTILPERELFIRWVQVSAYLPAMQFSIAPWQYDDEVVIISKKFVQIHEKEVTPLVLEAAKKGQPSIQPLWWHDPTDEFAMSIDSEFIVAGEMIVAPILNKGARSRDVYIPKGKWKLNGKAFNGPKWIKNVECPLSEILVFTAER